MILLWVDVETTGLEPKKDLLLEIAIRHADTEKGGPFVTREVLHERLSLGRELLASVQLRAHPKVLEMHQKNGLWKDMLGEDTLGEGGGFGAYPLWDRQLCDLYPAQKKEDDKPVLAGSSVHFDRGFLEQFLPKFASRLSYRLFDVTTIKLFCRTLGMPKPPRGEAHRAMADIEESIEHAKMCLSWLRGAP